MTTRNSIAAAIQGRSVADPVAMWHRQQDAIQVDLAEHCRQNGGHKLKSADWFPAETLPPPARKNRKTRWVKLGADVLEASKIKYCTVCRKLFFVEE